MNDQLAPRQADALKALAEADPDVAVKLRSSFLDRSADALGVAMAFEFDEDPRQKAAGRPGQPFGVPDALATLARIEARDAAALAKLRALDPAQADEVEDGRPLGVRLFVRLLERGRDDEVRAFARQAWRRLAREALAARDDARARIDRLSRVATSGGLDDRLAKMTAARDDLEKAERSLRTLLFDAGAAKDRARAIVEGFGGPDAVRSDLRDALLALGRFEEAAPAHGEAASADAEAGKLDALAKRVEPKGRLVARLKERLTRAKASAKAAAKLASEQAEAALDALAAGLLDADPASIARAKQLAAACPDAFEPGFATAFDGLDALSDDQLAGAVELTVRPA